MNPVNDHSESSALDKTCRYDLAIIGSGPGGYVAGLYASRHKLKVCVIEKDLVGGTCLNRGCIPTKSFLYSASVLKTVRNAGLYGVDVGASTINFQKMISRKDEAVLRLRTGIETLLRANKIDLLRGEARILGTDKIEVQGSGEISAKNIIIAAGSKITEMANIKIDHTNILSSDDILNINTVPASLTIIGGGVIGCEFASLFSALGSKVTIIEFTDRLIPTQSREASRKLETILKKKGITVFVSTKAESVELSRPLKIKTGSGEIIEADKVLVSIGRSPAAGSILGQGSDKIGVEANNGAIVVDGKLRTGAKNIYAIGDCVAGPMLAHKASYDGILACDNILGKNRQVDYSTVPNCIWTDPEIASVGLTEEEAKARCPGVKIAKFPYLASGKAFLMGKTEGFVKVIGDEDGKLLGFEIFGEGACELIGEAVLAKKSGINIKDWALAVHAHPTVSEVTQEALQAFCGTPIHGL